MQADIWGANMLMSTLIIHPCASLAWLFLRKGSTTKHFANGLVVQSSVILFFQLIKWLSQTHAHGAFWFFCSILLGMGINNAMDMSRLTREKRELQARLDAIERDKVTGIGYRSSHGID